MSDIHKQKIIRQLDFTLLLILQGLLRYGRTVDVANELGLSQPAVSHALRRLRELLGDPLFVRKPHGLAPTHHALALAPLIESILASADDVISLAGRFDAATSIRDFRIGSPDLLGPLIAAPLMRRFETDAPRARFALRTLVGDEATTALRQDQLDIAVGQFLKNIEGLSVEHLYDDEYVLLSRADHPTAGKPVTRKMLGQLSFVTLNPAAEFRGLTDDDFERFGVSRRIVSVVPRFFTALEMVSKTSACTLAPNRLAALYARRFRLEQRSLPVRLRPFRVQLVARTSSDAGRDWLIGILRSALLS